MSYLPMSQSEMSKHGWQQVDFIIITGDAYVDHPGFGAAVIGRYLQSKGYRVGIIAQPDWRKDEDFLQLGIPLLGFGITAGNMDSMVNHYTAQKKLRHDDAYSPGGISGLRPDRATLIYCNKVRQLFKNIPLIIGGIEASMRRIAHYDFWSDKVRNSILADSKADILVYGMGERAIGEILDNLKAGIPVTEITNVRGTVFFSSPQENATILPDAEDCRDKKIFYEMNRIFYHNFRITPLYQKTAGRWLKHNIPAEPLNEKEMDKLYALPFMRKPHPRYHGRTIPAWVQIKDSITSHRGCFGGCNFCTLGYHQGRVIQSRSEASILEEIVRIARDKEFKGTISDIGGPTANMYGMSCRQGFPASCRRNSCLYPAICQNLNISHKKIISLFKKALKIPEINHLFVASGIRYDLALTDTEYISQIAHSHTGGQIKLAPEHTELQVLKAIGKPHIKLYLDFCELFRKAAKQKDNQSRIVPYMIVGHPGCSMKNAVKLGIWLKEKNIRLGQVQEFTPTPMTISTCMYYSGLDFESGKPIFIPKGREIRLQKALVYWYDKKYSIYIKEALRKADKENGKGNFEFDKQFH